jgi:long-chain fatty acid transport protein
MKRRRARVLVASAACIWLTSISGVATAAGFQIFEQSVKGLGYAFAGNAASAEDASTIFFNPAGLSEVGTQLNAGAHLIIPSTQFNNQGSFLNPAVTGGTPVPGSLMGGNGNDPGETAVVPNLYASYAINDKWFVGIGVNAPYGLKTEYTNGWVGRYHAVKSELKTININPAAAYKLNDMVTVGVGLSAVYADAQLTNAFDQSTACLGATMSPAACAAVGLATPGSLATDAVVDLDNATDWDFGFNGGVLIQPGPGSRIGVHYRSPVNLSVTGDAKYSNVNRFFTSAGLLRNQRASATVTLPQTFAVSIQQAITEKWAVLADVTWTDWSSFSSLVINFTVPTQPATIQPENWEDTLRYSLGFSYKPMTPLTLRIGGAWDESPVPDAFRTPRIPDADRWWIAFGASYEVTNSLSFDFAYSHLFVSDTTINDTEISTGHTLVGTYTNADVNIISGQAVWRFN